MNRIARPRSVVGDVIQLYPVYFAFKASDACLNSIDNAMVKEQPRAYKSSGYYGAKDHLMEYIALS